MFSVYTNWRGCCLIRKCLVGHNYRAHIKLLFKLRVEVALKQNANLIFGNLDTDGVSLYLWHFVDFATFILLWDKNRLDKHEN